MKMRLQWNKLMLVTAAVLVLLPCGFGQGGVGVNYGLNGDNLPSPGEVVGLYQRCKIPYMRIFDPNHDVLEALRGTEIILSLGTRNEDIENLAASQEAATAWVGANVQPYANDVKIGWITVGNEVVPGPSAAHIGQAMTNVHNALASVGLSNIFVTTVVSMAAIISLISTLSRSFLKRCSGFHEQHCAIFCKCWFRKPYGQCVSLLRLCV
ncbi:hypothetical protein Pint_08251 [Pistacia integerrima]|uniref:Uncharacterized protein n=1 Tax=Pistacia integerrima TaxID=434235 RepID=A0ACC0XUH8_9ROSI|nr:hypothetical protein Pint_08251 [Pistacia integerrima]